MPDFEIVSGYTPGTIGRIAEFHGTYYHREHGFGLYFEAKVATEISEFLMRSEPKRDGLWTAQIDGNVHGAVVIDGIHASGEGAHLRWFIASDALRGKGAGGELLDTALAFCRRQKYRSVYLWTFEGLDAARHLYEKNGFKLTTQRHGVMWGTEVNEQRFECHLAC